MPPPTSWPAPSVKGWVWGFAHTLCSALWRGPGDCSWTVCAGEAHGQSVLGKGLHLIPLITLTSYRGHPFIIL